MTALQARRYVRVNDKLSAKRAAETRYLAVFGPKSYSPLDSQLGMQEQKSKFTLVAAHGGAGYHQRSKEVETAIKDCLTR